MPSSQTWLSVLWAHFSKTGWHNFHAFAAQLVGDSQGHTWLMHSDIELQHVLVLVLVLALLLVFGLVFRARVGDGKGAVVPEEKMSIRTLLEIVVGTTYDMMSDMMGPKAAKFFLPLIGTCALVILFSNAIGLVPGFMPATENFNTTLSMALVIFVATHVFGVAEHGVGGYFKHFLGPIWWMAPLMLPIELISHVARPLTLSIRLAANMTADHLVLGIFTMLVPFIIPLPMYIMGVIVVIVQTLVFCMLSAVYIALAIAHEEH